METASNVDINSYPPGFIKPGDYIVGTFTPTGIKLSDGGGITPTKNSIKKHAERTNNELLELGPKAKPTNLKKIKKVVSTPSLNIIEEKPLVVQSQQKDIQVRKEQIYFHSALGKIKLFVETVIESDIACCLVFSCEDDLIFIPNAGETLTMTDSLGKQRKVYFTGTVFVWTDNTKRLMILFNADEQS